MGLMFVFLFFGCSFALTWTPASITPVGGTESAPAFFWKYQGPGVVGFEWNATQTFSTFSDFYANGCRTDGFCGPMIVPTGNKKAWVLTSFQTRPCTWETVVRNGRFLGMDVIVVASSGDTDFVSFVFSFFESLIVKF
jgi:hypothetical protein